MVRAEQADIFSDDQNVPGYLQGVNQLGFVGLSYFLEIFNLPELVDVIILWLVSKSRSYGNGMIGNVIWICFLAEKNGLHASLPQ